MNFQSWCLLLLMNLTCYVSSKLLGTELGPDVVAYLGIPYAKPPLRELRFKESEVLPLDASRTFNHWPKRCIYDRLSEDLDEDCLYINILQHKQVQEKATLLLIITNEELSEKKLKQHVSKDLIVAVAHARDGLFGALGSATTHDLLSIASFLKENQGTFDFENITVWAEGSLAEAVDAIIEQTGFKRSILVNGNALTRTKDRERFSSRVLYMLRKESECELPSMEQSFDCLRSKTTEQLLELGATVTKSFYPFGNPFRVATKGMPDSHVPTIYGLYKKLPKGYPVDDNFTAEYSYQDFRRFLAGLIPDSLHKNGALLRRLVLHHYVHSAGDKKNTYFLFEQMSKILLDRDYRVVTETLVKHLASQKKKPVWLFEYGIDNPPKNCLQDGGWDDIDGFCNRMMQYFKRFAIKGAPTQSQCEPTNPTFPAMGFSKRDYYVILHADGKPEWEFRFYQPETQLWNHLLPELDNLELKGRRDAIFPEDEMLDPLEIEDDLQMWHERAAVGDQPEFTEEQILNDMPHSEL